MGYGKRRQEFYFFNALPLKRNELDNVKEKFAENDAFTANPEEPGLAGKRFPYKEEKITSQS